MTTTSCARETRQIIRRLGGLLCGRIVCILQNVGNGHQHTKITMPKHTNETHLLSARGTPNTKNQRTPWEPKGGGYVFSRLRGQTQTIQRHSAKNGSLGATNQRGANCKLFHGRLQSKTIGGGKRCAMNVCTYICLGPGSICIISGSNIRASILGPHVRRVQADPTTTDETAKLHKYNPRRRI